MTDWLWGYLVGISTGIGGSILVPWLLEKVKELRLKNEEKRLSNEQIKLTMLDVMTGREKVDKGGFVQGANIWKCGQCGAVFADIKLYDQHLINHSDAERLKRYPSPIIPSPYSPPQPFPVPPNKPIIKKQWWRC